MKKTFVRILLTAALSVAIVFSLASCDMLPDAIVDLLGGNKICEHTEVDWVVDIPSTCKAEGTQHSECKECGAIVEGQVKLELGEHTLGEWEIETEPTCKVVGSKYKKCSVCKRKVETEEIPITSEHAYSFGSCTVCSAEQPESEGLQFTSLGSGTASVTGIGSCKDMSLVIPALAPSGERVTSIAASAFSGKSTITSVIVPDSVTSVGDGAFSGTSLVSASVPAAIVASVKCASLKKLVVTGVGAIPANCMSAAQNLESVTICEGVTEIGDTAFSACQSLKTLVTPDSLLKLGNSAFARCSALYKVELGSGLTYIGDSAFSGAYSITTIKIPAAVKYIGVGAFASHRGSAGSVNLSKLMSVTFEVTEGWYSSANSNAMSGVSIDPAILADPSEAATALHTTYAYQCIGRN